MLIDLRYTNDASDIMGGICTLPDIVLINALRIRQKIETVYHIFPYET